VTTETTTGAGDAIAGTGGATAGAAGAAGAAGGDAAETGTTDGAETVFALDNNGEVPADDTEVEFFGATVSRGIWVVVVVCIAQKETSNLLLRAKIHTWRNRISFGKRKITH
jgi:hypothetical protein